MHFDDDRMHGSENTAQQYGGECALLNKEWTLPLSTLSSDFDVLLDPLIPSVMIYPQKEISEMGGSTRIALKF